MHGNIPNVPFSQNLQNCRDDHNKEEEDPQAGAVLKAISSVSAAMDLYSAVVVTPGQNGHPIDPFVGSRAENELFHRMHSLCDCLQVYYYLFDRDSDDGPHDVGTSATTATVIEIAKKEGQEQEKIRRRLNAMTVLKPLDNLAVDTKK